MYVDKDIIIEILKDEMPSFSGYMLNRYPNSVQIHYWNSESTIYTINFSWDKIYSLLRKKKIIKIKKSINVRY